MKKLIYILFLIPITVFCDDLPESELDKHLKTTTTWLKAFYANDKEGMRALQSDQFNATQQHMRRRTPMTNPKHEFVFDYKCQHYYITHAYKENKVNVPEMGGAGIGIAAEARSILSVFTFSECGKRYVKHLSGFRVNFNADNGEIISYKKELALYQEEGFSQEEITGYMNDYSVRMEKYQIESLDEVNIDAQKLEVMRRMGL